MWILFEDVLMLLNQVRPAAAAWCIIHLCARFPISSMLLCTQGRLSPVSGPERPRRPSFLPDGALSSFLLRSNHSHVFAEMWHLSRGLEPSSVIFVAMLVIFYPVSRISPLWTSASVVFWPLSWSSFPDETCFLLSPPSLPDPLCTLLHWFATFSSSPLFPLHFTFQLDSLHVIFSL